MTFNPKLIGLTTALAVSAALMNPLSVYAESDTENWWDSLEVSGDFRYRYEYIDQQDNEIRDRSRLRSRINFNARVNETVKVGLRLASGSDDPLSTNQSFDNFASTKGMGLDRGFVEWTPAEGSTIIAGKMGVPFYRSSMSSLIWDGDLNPEGLAYKYSNNGFFASIARFNLDECDVCDDSYLNGAQAGYAYKMAGGSKIAFGLGQYVYDLNTVETGIPDAYNETEFFAEYSTKLRGKPFSIYINYVSNSDGADLAALAGLNDDLDAGIETGVKFGQVNNAGDWDFAYTYKSIDAFSTFPLFNDADFAGGGTDGDGHIVRIGYGVNKNVSIDLIQFINKRGISADSDADPLTVATDYQRTQLDFRVNF